MKNVQQNNKIQRFHIFFIYLQGYPQRMRLLDDLKILNCDDLNCIEYHALNIQGYS